MKLAPSSLQIPIPLPHFARTNPFRLPNRCDLLPLSPRKKRSTLLLDVAATVFSLEAFGGEGVGANSVSDGLRVLDESSPVEI